VIVTDPATGEKVKGKSKQWWGQYKDAHGRLKRVPLAVDKQAAQAMLTQIVQRVEREKAGLVDPTEEQRKRPLVDHLREFQSYLRNKGVSENQVGQNLSKLRKMVAARKWRLIGDISASGALEFLGQLRRDGLSAQTYNNYLTAVKQFTRWLVRDRRTLFDPLAHLSRVNVLAAWTGFRKGEIGGLTLRSLRLEDDSARHTMRPSCVEQSTRPSAAARPSQVAGGISSRFNMAPLRASRAARLVGGQSGLASRAAGGLLAGLLEGLQ
jgi:hypothetical protein